ncbi:MAG: hypothetical protein KAW47_00220 [Thermoplasmatales archaeon]|nr:hypothetical protein [Thermoplasmatales archaeon]
MKNGNISKIHNSINEWTDKGKTVEEAAKKLEIDVCHCMVNHIKPIFE